MNTIILVLVGLLFAITILALLSPIIAFGGMLAALIGLLTGNGALAGWGALAWILGGGAWLYFGATPVYKVN